MSNRWSPEKIQEVQTAMDIDGMTMRGPTKAAPAMGQTQGFAPPKRSGPA